jgi:tetratricopeptide (TPR) repeat protein
MLSAGFWMEKKMRAFARLSIAALALFAAQPGSAAQSRSDDQIQPKSIELMQQGRSLAAAGKFEEAETSIEAALAVDPRNRWAYIEAARVAEKQRLYGKAIRLTGKALAMEPNDLDALAVQGEAMVELGALARARTNLDKIKTICTKGCPQVAQLQTAITRGPTAVAKEIVKADAADSADKPNEQKN